MRCTINTLILALSLLTFNSYANVGLGDWNRKTPNGNEINNFYSTGLTLRLKDGQLVQELSRWYFYKGNIIGQLHNGSYFIANEKTYQVNVFQNALEFEHVVALRSYKPLFWTRWHTTDWAPLDDILFIALLALPISIILFILFCIISYMSVIKEKLNHKKLFTKILIIISLFTLINVALEYFPQSI